MLTIEQIQERIASVDHSQVPDTGLTLCVLTLKSGYAVSGDIMVMGENADQEKADNAAFERAFAKLVELCRFMDYEQAHDLRAQILNPHTPKLTRVK